MCSMCRIAIVARSPPTARAFWYSACVNRERMRKNLKPVLHSPLKKRVHWQPAHHHSTTGTQSHDIEAFAYTCIERCRIDCLPHCTSRNGPTIDDLCCNLRTTRLASRTERRHHGQRWRHTVDPRGDRLVVLIGAMYSTRNSSVRM